MIISKTPFRISFVGGGSDIASFYQQHGGAVVSTTINKYIYITVNKSFDDKIRIKYSRAEEVNQPSRLKHRRAGEILKLLGIDKSIEISSLADIPSKGTGLGSSSSFTVGLLHALYAYKEKYASPEKLASKACEIEIELLGEPIGKQDQYSAAFGGLNIIRFNPDESVNIDPIICKKKTISHLEENLILFYTGITRKASSILLNQKENLVNNKKKITIMKEMVKNAIDLAVELQKDNVQAFGEILHHNWLLKKEMANGISNQKIDFWYDKAMRAGAKGGKLLGAGGGGFLLFYAPKEKHGALKKTLSSLRHTDFKFEFEGSKIIFVHD